MNLKTKKIKDSTKLINTSILSVLYSFDFAFGSFIYWC